MTELRTAPIRPIITRKESARSRWTVRQTQAKQQATPKNANTTERPKPASGHALKSTKSTSKASWLLGLTRQTSQSTLALDAKMTSRRKAIRALSAKRSCSFLAWCATILLTFSFVAIALMVPVRKAAADITENIDCVSHIALRYVEFGRLHWSTSLIENFNHAGFWAPLEKRMSAEVKDALAHMKTILLAANNRSQRYFNSTAPKQVKAACADFPMASDSLDEEWLGRLMAINLSVETFAEAGSEYEAFGRSARDAWRRWLWTVRRRLRR